MQNCGSRGGLGDSCTEWGQEARSSMEGPRWFSAWARFSLRTWKHPDGCLLAVLRADSVWWVVQPHIRTGDVGDMSSSTGSVLTCYVTSGISHSCWASVSSCVM